MGQAVPRRLVDPDALVSTWEISERIGVDPTNVWHWAKELSGFPRPVARLGKGRRLQVWLWPEVAKWAISRGVLDPRCMPTRDPSGDAVEDDDLLTGKQVAELLGWSSAGAAWQAAQHGTFPWPVREERPRMWRRSDVETWSASARRQPSRRKRS